jgi:hypothetical protein
MQATGPPIWAAARRATLGVLFVTLLWIVVGVAYPNVSEAVPTGVAAEQTGVLEIVTVPAVQGARFTIDGRTHRADSQGVVRVKVSTNSRHKISAIDPKIADHGRTLTFKRWYHGNHDKDHLTELSGLTVKRNLRIKVGYQANYTLEYSFVDKAHYPVDRERVSRVEFRGDNGATVTGNGSGRLSVVGVRPVVTGGTLIAKKVSYSVQRVDVDGSNVVQVNNQRFIPSRQTTVVIPLQLHTVHFSAHDLLFGQPVGQAVWLKYPDGHQVRVPLDSDGKATVERLAKGSYTVRVDASGLSVPRPLVLSRNQYVELPHVSRLDISVVVAAVTALMLSLYLVRKRGRSVYLRTTRLRSARTWAAGRR